jgi:hypothetical protein
MVVHHKEDCVQQEPIKEISGRLSVIEKAVYIAYGGIIVLLAVFGPAFKQTMSLILELRQDRSDMVQIMQTAARDARQDGQDNYGGKQLP